MFNRFHTHATVSSITHLHTHSLPHSFTRSFTYSVTHSLIHTLIYALTSLRHPFYSFTQTTKTARIQRRLVLCTTDNDKKDEERILFQLTVLEIGEKTTGDIHLVILCIVQIVFYCISKATLLWSVGTARTETARGIASITSCVDMVRFRTVREAVLGPVISTTMTSHCFSDALTMDLSVASQAFTTTATKIASKWRRVNKM